MKISDEFAIASAKLRLQQSEKTQNQPALDLFYSASSNKTRTVNTDDGEGDIYIHPTKPSFDNPITAVYHVKNNCACLKFETGEVNTHSPKNPLFKRLPINQFETPITRIKVFKGKEYITGIQFIGKEEVILIAGGSCQNDYQEIVVREGERLIGIRSRRLKNDIEDLPVHCRIEFVFGVEE